MNYCGLLLLLLYHIRCIKKIYTSHTSNFTSINQSDYTKFQADFLFGALFPMHEKGYDGNSKCSKLISEVRGIQRLEAFFYAVDKINNDGNILKNVRISYSIHDTCGQSSVALDQTVATVIKHLSSSHKDCHRYSIDYDVKEKFVGVIGPASSMVSKEVANLLRLFQVPQISYASTSSILNDRKRFNYFLRTVPPDTYQADAMIDVCKELGWTSVVVIYSEDSYGESGFKALRKSATLKDVCIVKSVKLTDSTDYDKALSDIHKQTKIVILFCLFPQYLKLFSASSQGNYPFTWIIGEIYGFDQRSVGLNHKININNIILLSLSRSLETVKSFTHYFNNLNPLTNHRNIWFRKYWEQKYNCTLVPFTCPLDPNDEIIYDDKISYVVDSVYALASAVDSIYKRTCPQQNGVCAEMKYLNGKVILEELLTSEYNGAFERSKFDVSGSIMQGYDISYYDNGNLTPLGSYSNKTLKIYNKEMTNKVTSYCATQCGPGYAKSFHLNYPQCCYSCKKCSKNSIASRNEKGCISCPVGTQPNRLHTECVTLPIHHLDRKWVISISVLAGIGVVVTVWFMLIFYYHKDSYIIITSAPELSYPLFVGVLLSYLLTLFIIAEQSIYLCGVRRFGLGFSFTICYGALLTKTNRLARVFNDNRLSSPPRFIDATSQVIILFVLVFFQCGLSLIGFFMHTPSIEFVNENGHLFLSCIVPLYDSISSFTYNFILVCVCTVYAFRTRKVPACFNETRNIGFVMYVTMVLWMSFIPAYVMSLSKSNEAIALCLNVVLHATSILAGVFGPKIYMIVFHWDKAKKQTSLHSFSQSLEYSNDIRIPSSIAVPRKMTSVSLYSDISKIRSISASAAANKR